MELKIDQVFIDTSAFKALMDSGDEFNERAALLLNSLIKKGSCLVTSNFIIDESVTLLRTRCGLENALKLKEFLGNSDPLVKIVRTKVGDEVMAWKWFKKDWSKLSFTDCVSFAMMKRMGVKKVFGFDKHFERAGFEMVR